jgi:hypothetical protein
MGAQFKPNVLEINALVPQLALGGIAFLIAGGPVKRRHQASDL